MVTKGPPQGTVQSSRHTSATVALPLSSVSMEVSNAALDYLLIEAVPLSKEVCKELGYVDDAAETEACFRVEKYGFKVGKGLAQVITRNRPRLSQQLDIVKFVCKDLWMVVFHKQMDNLKTNHRDTFVLVDNNFPYCLHMSTKMGPENTVLAAAPYLWFPCGIIRGFMAALGVQCSVQFDTAQLPQVSFQVLIES